MYSCVTPPTLTSTAQFTLVALFRSMRLFTCIMFTHPPIHSFVRPLSVCPPVCRQSVYPSAAIHSPTWRTLSSLRTCVLVVRVQGCVDMRAKSIAVFLATPHCRRTHVYVRLQPPPYSCPYAYVPGTYACSAPYLYVLVLGPGPAESPNGRGTRVTGAYYQTISRRRRR